MKKLSSMLFAGALSLSMGMGMNSAFAIQDGYMGDFGDTDGHVGGGLYGPYAGHHHDAGFGGGFGGGYGGGFGAYGDGCYSDCPPPCGMNNDCCSRFAFGVDYLYWDVTQSGLDVAQTTVAQISAPSSDACCCDAVCKQDTEFFDWSGKSGYRLGLSYQLPCWEDTSLNFVYTYFHPKVHNRFRVPKVRATETAYIQLTTDAIDIGTSPVANCIQGLTPAGFNRFDGPDSLVHTRIKLKYELFDLVFSRNYGCDSWTLTPYAGARVLWIRQVLRNEISGSYSGLADTTASYAFAWRRQLPAGGFTAGVHGRYAFCGSLNVIGHIGASVLGGKAKYQNKYFPSTSFDCEKLGRCGHHNVVVTGWDGSLGLGYDLNFCTCPVRLGVGYEIQDWWGLPERVRYINNYSTTPITTAQTSDANGRLTVHGLFVRVAFAF